MVSNGDADDESEKKTNSPKKILLTTLKIIGFILFLYLFIISLGLLSNGFKVLRTVPNYIRNDGVAKRLEISLFEIVIKWSCSQCSYSRISIFAE